VLLAGNALFILASLAVPFCATMPQFLCVRFVQGMGTSFVFIGYAVLHELLDDVAAVKMTTLLSNAGIFAPLIGPALGSMVLSIADWRVIFFIACAMAVVAFIGIARFLPGGAAPTSPARTHVVGSYVRLLRNPRFMLGCLVAGLSLAPLTAWIGLSPAILLDHMGESRSTYIQYQVFIFSGFVISSLFVQRLADRLSMETLVRGGTSMAIAGILAAAALHQSEYGFIAGMALFSAGLGLFNGALLRMTMRASTESTRLSSAVLSLIYCASIAAGLEGYNRICAAFDYSLMSYALANVPVVAAVYFLARRLVRTTGSRASPGLVAAT
jgi:DHA1 family multidrug/chloramphenicol efflux transport protein-like MFS transporter